MFAIVSGANTGMGLEITRSLAEAGYDVLMACYDVKKGESAREMLIAQTGNKNLEVRHVDLASLDSVRAFAESVLAEGRHIDLMMNNAGSLKDRRIITGDGLEYNVSVNYVGPYLLTRMLLPLMGKGTRIVNMASLVYRFGSIRLPEFFTMGCRGSYNRFVVYSNSKLAITLFTLNLARRLEDKGITVNASDPWIVSTDIIKMNNKLVDTLCDKIFRPIIYTPQEGASTAIDLLLNPEKASLTGSFNKNCHSVKLPQRVVAHPLMDKLWNETERIIAEHFAAKGMDNPLA